MARATVLLFLMVVAMGTMVGVGGKGITVSPDVETRLGLLRGTVQQAGPDRHFYSFRGIPYAKPPVGSLRFQDPMPAEPWYGVRETFDPPMCPQINIETFLGIGELEVTGEEDCLYLHVYKPNVEGYNFPVMVFIHGGGYVLGSPDYVGGSPMPLMTRDVILVSMQYRLGTLGFMSTGDEVMPGNLGLKDQTLALRWVHDNIYSFGGNPNKVTVFGESAGGGSVHLQILSPSAAGLFQRAIMESGNALCPWSLRDDHRQMAAVVGSTLGCTEVEDQDGNLNSLSLLNCVRKTPVDELVMAQIPGQTWNFLPTYMVPRIDGGFLPAHPAHLLREGQYNKVDIISGVCALEGAAFAIGALSTPEGERLADNFNILGSIAVGMDQEETGSSYLAHRIFYQYLGRRYLNISVDQAVSMAQMASDVLFTVPHDVVSQFHAQDNIDGRKVYMYQFEYRGQVSFLDIYNLSIEASSDWVGHGDDILYLFNDTFKLPALERSDDLVMREIMLDLWTNFAACGNPTPTMALGFKWSPVSPSCLHYLSLTPGATMKQDPRVQTREFLLNLPTKQNKLLFPEKFNNEDTSNIGHCHV